MSSPAPFQRLQPAIDTTPDQPTRHDPWAHRRAEPRFLALVWAIYLFAATLTTFGHVAARLSVSPDTMAPAARTMVVLVIVGVVILWPLIRLSQAPDPKPLRGPARDLLVIVLPLAAVLLPQSLPWLAHWPLQVTLAATAWCIAWAAVIAATLALVQLDSTSAAAGRISHAATLMAAIIAANLLLATPALLDAATVPGPRGEAPAAFRPAFMLSPVTGMIEITRERLHTGRSANITLAHWIPVAAVFLTAAALWTLAVWRATRHRA